MSSRNTLSAAIDSTLRFDAEITRQFTGNSCVPPTRTTFLLSRTRNKLGCMSMGISVISSKNKVPFSACMNTPSFLATAPVNAPFSWPNNSLPISSLDRAPQLVATNLPSALLALWIAWATTSLPTPLSPNNITLADVLATRSIIKYSSCIAADSPIRQSKCALVRDLAFLFFDLGVRADSISSL